MPDATLLERDEASGVERYTARWLRRSTRTHAHPEYQLTLSDAGSGRCAYHGGTALVPPGCAAFLHAGEPHTLSTASRDQPWTLRSFHIPARWLDGGGAPLLQPAPLLCDGDLRDAFETLWSAFPGGRLERPLADLAAALRRRPGLEPVPRPDADTARRCMELLAGILDRPVSAAELARAARCPPQRVRRAFAAATGQPPGAWHLQRRIDEAKHRLRRGTPINDVALGCGFADQAHFTRHFTRLVGISPSRYAAGAAPGR